ncbi:APC family permease [Thalassotalea sp. HSM 43]|uniref:APC family permease n=1 Tax=Thalassotalea sp. HSM 43 TaxID=2552945 RepID=UPI00108179A1|nr:APC family permease [Thalassotalea sp. HSM 43]QBY04917.1 APC family permease [Thalassotalea sp. HSM 43]
MVNKLTKKEITLFTISAILTIDGIAAAAAIGVQSLTWWVLSFICFAIPYALISAKLGTQFPSKGGIVHWVKLALGDKWAARTSWLYWINVALWMPAAFIMLAGFSAELFWPGMPLYWQIIIALIATWISVAVCIISPDSGKWVPIIGAWCKMLVVLLLGIGGVMMAFEQGVANTINISNLTPSWDAGLQFFPVIIFSLMGFDLICCSGDEMENPKRDLPISLLVAGVIITALYLFAVLGILVAIPVEDIGLVTGLLQTFERMLAPLPFGDILLYMVGFMAIFSFIANIVTWGMGANRAASEAAHDNELPAVFAIDHKKYGTPVGASLLTGVVSTTAILLYGTMASSAEGLFWALFSFANLIFLLPYLALFPTYMILQKSAGKKALSKQLLLVVPAMAFLVQAIVFFIFPPGGFNINDFLVTSLGLATVLLIGEYVIHQPLRKTLTEQVSVS